MTTTSIDVTLHKVTIAQWIADNFTAISQAKVVNLHLKMGSVTADDSTITLTLTGAAVPAYMNRINDLYTGDQMTSVADPATHIGMVDYTI